jgi:hypothetical protein
VFTTLTLEKIILNMQPKNKTMANTNHKDIPGNPSTATSSKVMLRKEVTPDTLRVLTMEQWHHWRKEGYVVVKGAVPREQAQHTADFIW